MMAKTAEFKPIELKDYGYESGLTDELISKDSLINNFKFTEALDFDQQFEGVAPNKFLSGSFGKIDADNGFEILTDNSKKLSYLQSLGFVRNGRGFRLDSSGNIISTEKITTGYGGKRIEIDGKKNRIDLYGEDNTINGRLESFYNSGNGFMELLLTSGGSAEMSISGISNQGDAYLGFNDGSTIYGLQQNWTSGNLSGTMVNLISGRMAYVSTPITVGANFTLSATAIVTPYIKLTGTAARTSSVTTAIANAAETGQILILEGTSDVNTITILDGANTQLAASMVLGQYDTLTLLFNGTQWIELARSNN